MDYGITAGLRSQTLGWASWEDKQRYVTGLITKGTASTMATGDRTSTSALSKKSPPAKLGILFTEKAHILNDALFGNLLSKKKIALQNLNYVAFDFAILNYTIFWQLTVSAKIALWYLVVVVVVVVIFVWQLLRTFILDHISKCNNVLTFNQESWTVLSNQCLILLKKKSPCIKFVLFRNPIYPKYAKCKKCSSFIWITGHIPMRTIFECWLDSLCLHG